METKIIINALRECKKPYTVMLDVSAEMIANRDNHLGYFESLIDKGTAFCHRCGQVIDWEEGEADA